MSIIKVEGLTKYYDDFCALNGVSFSIEKGEIIGLLGPNGAGKTTTMKILAGYLQPSDGVVMVGGHDVVTSPKSVQALLGYLPENAPLYLDMRVQDYLVLMAELRGIPESEQRAAIAEAVHSTQIAHRLADPIQSLSKGYRQRVCLAQAILHKPQVLILDEPTNGLDPDQILQIRALIRRLAENATVIVSTHILSEVEATCHRAIIIMDGQVKTDQKIVDLTRGNDAVVAIDAAVQSNDVVQTLGKVSGVRAVIPSDGANGFRSYRIQAEKGIELCPRIFDVAKDKNWRVSELRPDVKTLETVFRQLGHKEGVQA